MALTPNGWSVIEADQCVDLVVAGVHFPRGVRAGDVATVLRWVAQQHHTRVEPLKAGTCWGYDKKHIGTSTKWSEHAAGNAIDVNADQHNQGHTPTSSAGGYTVSQVAECHRIETDSGLVVRWGGDFSNPDGMHWEIIGNAAAVASFARKIREAGDVTLQEVLDIAWGRGTNRQTLGELVPQIPGMADKIDASADKIDELIVQVKALTDAVAALGNTP